MKIINSEKKLNNKGFSLIELIVVIAVMAILVGVAMVTASMLDSSYVEDAEMGVKDYIGMARTKSMSVSAKDWYVNISKDGANYYAYLYKTIEERVESGSSVTYTTRTVLVEKRDLGNKITMKYGVATDDMKIIDAAMNLELHFDAATGKVCKVIYGGIEQSVASGIGYIGIKKSDYDITLKVFYNTGKCERE